MATVTSRRSRTRTISKQAIEQANAHLQQLPERTKEDLSLREAVEQIREQIESALRKGYSYQDLVSMLAEQGIAISAATLKRYVPVGRSRTRKGRPPTQAKTRRTRKGQTQDSTSDSEDAQAQSADIESDEAESDADPSEAPKRRRGRTAKTSEPEATSAPEAEAEPASRRRSSRTGSRTSSSKSSSRGTSTRGRKKADA
jgi:hypothetical protein